MAYRDPLESRRAHLERRRARLAQLKEDERLIRDLPDQGSLLARVLGGSKVAERTIRLPRTLEPQELAAHAGEAFDIEGRVAEDATGLLWRAEPEPRPRRVEVRVGTDEAGPFLRIRDESSRRRWVAFFVFLGMVPYTLQHGAGLVAAVLFVMLSVGFVAARRRARRLMRRRLWQAEQLARLLTKSTAAPVRIASDAREPERESEPEESELEAAVEEQTRARHG